MVRRSSRPCTGLILAILAIVFGMPTVGCNVPGYVGRSHVDANLACRTAQQLGPEKSPCEVLIPDGVVVGDGLSEEEAVALGLWNNPGYQELLADLCITRADVIQANQLANPEISTMFPLSVKQWEFTLSLPLDILLLRPRRVAAAQLESKRVAERLVQDGLNVVCGVRHAYIDLVLAEQRLRLAEEGAELRSHTTQMAEARLQAGAVAELDVSALRIDAMFAREEVTRARYDVDLAREQLRMLLGIESTDIDVETVPMAGVPATELDVELLVCEAVASRPDLRAQEIAYCAACERVRLAQIDYLNIRGVLPDINGKGENGFEAGPGLQMTLPILNQNQGAIAQAKAEAVRLRRQLTTMQDTTALEVRQAHTRLLQAEQDARIWRDEIVPQAATAVATARKALEEDGVSLLLVLETTRQSLDARANELQALAEVHRAAAELERSVGRSLFFEPVLPTLDEGALVPEPAPQAMEPMP